MNKVKEIYKTIIVEFIADNYAKLNYDINILKDNIPENALNERYSTLKYMKNLIKTITSEEDEEIENRIKEANERFYENAMKKYE